MSVMRVVAKRWWFVLGREHLLSLAELHQIFPQATFFTIGTSIASASITLEPATLINQIGGVVKIAEQISDALSADELLQAITHELTLVTGKIHFGLSAYPGTPGSVSVKQIATWGLTIKKLLKGQGLSVRYVDNRGATILSSASVLNNGLTDRGREFIIVPQGAGFALAKTVALQPFESFSARDFGRPGRDDVSGMLPPKLAMMMINCAHIPKNKTLYDPSCGSGTILSEAMLLGYTKLVGSDISAKAIENTKQNIAWVRGQVGATGPEATLFEHTIEKRPTQFDPKELSGIVSEPFMGPPLKGRETTEQLQKTARELATLYIATFRSFSSFLPKDASVVYIFPRFSTSIRTAELVVPEIKKLGFKVVPLLPAETTKDPFVLYQRPDQRVGREIWKFTF